MKVIVFLLLLGALELKGQEVTFLKLKQAFKYENNKDVPEFSGLCIKDESLYSINDKSKNYLYKLELDTIKSIFHVKGNYITKGKDFESIDYFNNSFFTVDERSCKVYKIVNDNAVEYSKEFLTSLDMENLIDRGENGNKQVESFSMLNDSTFIVATERGITSLAVVNIEGNILLKKIIPPIHYDDSCLPDALTEQDTIIKDSNSFSDLCIFEGKIYLLERKKKLIYIAEISKDLLTITKAISFRNGINSCDEYHNYYGAAEGLAINHNYIYIILDNNGKGQKQKQHMCDKNRKTLFQYYNDGF